MEHRHLIIRAEVSNPPTDKRVIESWLVVLTEKINMKIAAGPISSYVTKKGNEGLTATVLIETSHIVIHVWDKYDPPLIQFDLYSCGAYHIESVMIHFSIFNPTKLEYKYLNRDESLQVLNEGRMENGSNWTTQPLDSNRIQRNPL